MKAEQAWQAAQGQLQMEMPKAAFDTWVRNAEFISYEDGSFIIGVSTPTLVIGCTAASQGTVTSHADRHYEPYCGSALRCLAKSGGAKLSQKKATQS